jgi:hypothetical protein
MKSSQILSCGFISYHVTQLNDRHIMYICGLRLKCDGTCAETRFCLSAKRTSPFKSPYGEGGVSLVDYWQASCAHQPARFVLPVQACVLHSRDAYWLPAPFSCFPFAYPPVRHSVPSHFSWTLPTCMDVKAGVLFREEPG